VPKKYRTSISASQNMINLSPKSRRLLLQKSSKIFSWLDADYEPLALSCEQKHIAGVLFVVVIWLHTDEESYLPH
jgi:hypothetical protein